jgi:hypothetical protein
MQNAKMDRVDLRLGPDLKRDTEAKAAALGMPLAAYIRAVVAAHANGSLDHFLGRKKIKGNQAAAGL